MAEEYAEIKQSPLDSDFRWEANKIIGLARKEICIVTGEFSIYYFSDVRESLRDALHRGVKIKAYMGKCDEDTIHRAVSDGIVAYPGKKLPPKDHYMIIDNKHVIVSKEHQRYRDGVRHGYYSINNKKDAQQKKRLFDKLIDNIEPVIVPIRNKKRDLEFIEELYH